jgi:hypothetical protein
VENNQRTSRISTSVILTDLLDDLHAERVTLGWLTAKLGDRSFGIILLLLALLGMLPGVSFLAGGLLVVPAFQMVRAHPNPIFTRRIAALQFGVPRVVGMIRRTVPVLQYLERFIRPRWPTPFEATKRSVGVVVLLLGVSMLAPIPLSNIPPAILIALIAFAYLEEDGALLCAAFGATLLLLTVFVAIVWQSANMAGLLPATL